MSLPSNEQWRPIPGYEGQYDVSDHGRVRSWMPYRGLPAPRPMKLGTHEFGYTTVRLRLGGTSRIRPVHSLVALAFIGPRPDGLEIRHLNGNPADNRAANLRYGTRSQNVRDKHEHGTDHQINKTHCPRDHEYTSDNTYVRPGPRPRRECRTCRRQRQRDHEQRKRTAAAR